MSTSLIGTAAGKAGAGFWEDLSTPVVPPKPTNTQKVIPEVKKIPLAADQYYQGVYQKTHIFLHHTAGGSAAGAIAGWSSNPENVATPYVIERTGDIYECYDPKFWAYHLGIKGGTALEKASIGIEIVSYGNLTLKDGKYLTYTNRILPESEVLKIDFRGFKYYQRYTEAQIASLKILLPYLMDRFKIKLQDNTDKFWEFSDPSKLPPGIYSHTTVRKDKVDIFPQPEIVELVKGL